MHNTPLNQLLDRLIAVAEDLSMGRYGKYDDIFELTKSGQYPPLIARFAESFGMMAVKVEAAHQMMVMAARKKDSGERNDMEAGMAKYLASEYCKEVVEDSFRIHGGYGYSKEYEIERLYREAPMMLIGEGTADIQRMIIARRLLEDYKTRG